MCGYDPLKTVSERFDATMARTVARRESDRDEIPRANNWEVGSVIEARVVDPRALSDSDWELMLAAALMALVERLETGQGPPRRIDRLLAKLEAEEGAFAAWRRSVLLRAEAEAETERKAA